MPNPVSQSAELTHVAVATGSFAAVLHLELEHDLTMSLPLGCWTVHDDRTAPEYLERRDQGEIEKLARRQKELAGRSGKLLADTPLDEAASRQEIEEIRQEQSRIAAQIAQLKQKNQLVQESVAALQQVRVERLARDARRPGGHAA